MNNEKGCSKMNIEENWEDLKYFMALANEKRLQKAAKLIKSNHTTVYRRILNFEQKFDIKLFESTPAGYFLTPAGEELYLKLEGLEERMDSIFNSIQGLETKLKGRILITTTHSIATTFLPKILKKFKKKWPDLLVDLKVSNQFYNLSKREADIAIRPASDVPLHLMGRNLGKLNFSLYGTKAYFKGNRKRENVFSNIEKHTFIALDESLEHLRSKKWLDSKLNDESRIYKVDDLTVMAKMCSEGVGLALLPHYFEGVYKNLDLIFEPKEFIGNDLWILTHKNMSKVPKVKTCTDFLYEEISRVVF
ncbi:MAG: DNA-binding transcriptional LysR family regulator [Bacteriovoracaceae bacterium]